MKAWASVVLLVLASALWVSPARGGSVRASMGFGEAEAALSAANNAFRLGAAQSAQGGAAPALDEAVAGYRELIGGGYDTGMLRYNLANAYLLRGDLGEAIVEYRIARARRPGDALVAGNLAYARSLVRTAFDRPAEEAFARVALFWHFEWPASVRVGLTASLLGLAWLAAAGRLMRAPVRAPAALIAASAAVGAVFGASVAAEAAGLGARTGGVIVAQESVARRGPDAKAYAPAFTEPLAEGVEFVVIERRSGWLLSELPDGRRAWLDRSAVALLPAGV